MVPPPGCHYEYEYHFEHDRDLVYGTEYIDEHVAHYFTNGLVRYVMQDANYNAVGYVNEVEALVYQFAYHPYGQFLEIENGSGANISNPGMFARFQGLWLDRETGMYNVRVRYLDVDPERYLSRDTLGTHLSYSSNMAMMGEEPGIDLDSVNGTCSECPSSAYADDVTWQYDDGQNLYAYVGQNPLVRKDPTGQYAIKRRVLRRAFVVLINR